MRTYPIDIVYLWCDGAEESFAAEKNKCARKFGISLSDDNNGDARFENHDELKFSLRSVEKYAPWIRTVFIAIADSQSPPKWLNLEHPKVKIVHHSDFIPKAHLPVFDSNTIEHFIARIPGLSEHFLCANDDMMFNRSVDQDFFFSICDGKPICRFREPVKRSTERISDYLHYLDNAARIVKESCKRRSRATSKAILRLPHHCIDGYCKSDMIAIYEKHKCEIEPAFKNPFRSEDDIQRILYSYDGIQHYGWHFKQLAAEDGDSMVCHKYHPLAKIAGKLANPALICVNDSGLKTSYEQKMSRALLEDILLPAKSAFEKVSPQQASCDESERTEHRLKTLNRLELYIAQNKRNNIVARYRLRELAHTPEKATGAVEVSFIVSTLNSSAGISRFFDSVFSATDMPVFEIVCVDEGSLDDTKDIVESWADATPKVRLVDQNVAGVAERKNAGLEAASGEYVVFLRVEDRIISGKNLELAYANAHSRSLDLMLPVAGLRKSASSLWGCLIRRSLFAEKGMPHIFPGRNDGLDFLALSRMKNAHAEIYRNPFFASTAIHKNLFLRGCDCLRENGLRYTLDNLKWKIFRKLKSMVS